MLPSIRLAFLRLARPLTIWVGQQTAPFIFKKITGKHYLAVKDYLRPGMVFVSKSYGHLSNLFVPGRWCHSAIYVGNGKVVEALGDGVEENLLIDFMLRKDEIAILTPKFACKHTMDMAAGYAKAQVGKPYDYDFVRGNDSLYCSELIWSSYDHATGGHSPFTVRKTMGVSTVTPDDIYNAKSKWSICWEANK